MKYLVFGAAVLALAGCNRPSSDGAGAQGRYVGIGIISPGALWTKIAGVEKPADPAAATPADDEQLIVVVDSRTGEVRQCGNLSGVCIQMNPWSKPGINTGGGAVKLTEHLADIRAREAAERAAAPPAK